MFQVPAQNVHRARNSPARLTSAPPLTHEKLSSASISRFQGAARCRLEITSSWSHLTMALPHQVPLYKALDAVDSHDFEAAEREVNHFFEALENDAIAKDCRRQHFERQVFEADFLSILTKEEIDAWGILATVKLSRDDLAGARADCYRMIELIDQYYGFDTPSWDSPEARIPINPELMSRYFQIASFLAEIYEQLDDMEMSQRWANVRRTAVSDIQQPEEVWGRWISEDEAAMAVGITIYEFSDWQIEKRTVDGREWLANVYRSLSERVSPHEMNWLVAIHIPTDEKADVPSKATRWKIWSLRLAIAARFHRADVGAYFGELQTRGERILLYYASGKEEATEALGHILEDASELNPVLEIRHDEGWREYSKWSNSSVIVSSPTTVPMPEPYDNEHENDKLLRDIWAACESIHDASSRLYTLVCDCAKLPPQGAEFKRFCIEYLFGLKNQLSGKNRTFALIQMVWNLPKFDADAAIRAFDELWVEPYPDEDDTTLNLAACEFAEVAPLKALEIAKYLKSRDYSIVHTSLAKIAQKLALSDRKLAMEIAQDARKGIIEGNDQDFGKASFLMELAGDIAELSPQFAREMLIEAEAFMHDIDTVHVKDQVYLSLLHLAKKHAPDKLPEFCARAVENSLKLEEEDPNDYWGFGGPTRAIFSQTNLVPFVAAYDKEAALDLLSRSFGLLNRFEEEAFDRILHLSNIADAAASLDASSNRALAEDVWSELTKSMDQVSSKDSYFLSQRFENGAHSPIIPFVAMNPAVANDRFSSVIKICNSATLPEREVTLLCTFATLFNADFPKRAKELISLASERATECSSEQLCARACMQVVATMDKVGLPSENEFEHVLNKIRSSADEATKFHLLLECATSLTDSSPDKCAALLNEATRIFEENEIEQGDAIELIKQLPARQCSKLLFLVLDKNKNESQRRAALGWLSNQFGKGAVDRSEH